MKVLVWTVFPLWCVIFTRRYLWTLYRRKTIWWVGAARSVWWIFSEKYIFEGSFTEEGTGAGKAVFEEVFNLLSSEARKKFHSIASAFQIEENWSASPSTQEYQKLEGKLEHGLTGEWLGSNQERSGNYRGSSEYREQEYRNMAVLSNLCWFMRDKK